MATEIVIDLRLTPAQRAAIRDALVTLETMVDSAKYQKLLAYWDLMDQETKEHVLSVSPGFARLVALARRLPD